MSRYSNIRLKHDNKSKFACGSRLIHSFWKFIALNHLIHCICCVRKGLCHDMSSYYVKEKLEFKVGMSFQITIITFLTQEIIVVVRLTRRYICPIQNQFQHNMTHKDKYTHTYTHTRTPFRNIFPIKSLSCHIYPNKSCWNAWLNI